jgi:hypothetical protein
LVEEYEENPESIRQEKHRLQEYVQELSIKLGRKQKLEEEEGMIRSMDSEAEERDELIDSFAECLQLREVESKLAHQASKMKIVEAKLQSLHEEKV